MQECSIIDFPDHIGEDVTIKGWVSNRRSSGRVSFIIFRDGTGICQVIAERDTLGEIYPEIKKIPLESSIIVHGKVVEESRAAGGFEVQANGIEIVQKSEEFPIGKKEHGPDFLLSNRHLWLRSSRQTAIMRVRDCLVRQVRNYFYENGFTLIDTPIFTTTCGEDTSNLFWVDYFDLGKTYLSQTGQLYLEAAISGLGKVYCLGPTFRAERSKTRRHLTEFWMVEGEMAFYDHKMNLELQEDFVSYIVQNTLAEKEQELLFLERDIEPLKKVVTPFHRISYDEALDILRKQGSDIQWGADLGADDETVITQMFDKPVFIENYPKQTKAFYMKQHPDNPKYVYCADLLAPEGYGEIIGGSQREDDYDVLLKAIKDNGLEPERYEWYLDLRKYGSVPHSGFGLGIERTLAWICGLKHVRETIPFPRMIYRAYP
ncbi:MAG TPA: asparagine--tRNA ligase [Deltaproteobacteria bacterium]|nr:asparagine--tRNA ligase [Deltaproteobacteria bacterium]HPJ94013.1 asparagine--tRNA ligase [Deltaproteobacteria bacterium]HPR52756.1 asparagine--tRNA ligase [Deltaproteobacteria bacterium]